MRPPPDSPLRRPAALAVILFVMVSASASPAASACPPVLCRCGSASTFGLSEKAFVAKQRDRADWVATAQVLRIDTLAPVVLSLTRRSVTTRPIVARLAVSRTWQGEPRDTQTVLLSTTDYRSTCDLAFAAGDSYLVFASRAADGQLQPQRCGGTVRLRDAAAMLEVLGFGTDVTPSGSPAAGADRLLNSLAATVATERNERHR